MPMPTWDAMGERGCPAALHHRDARTNRYPMGMGLNVHTLPHLAIKKHALLLLCLLPASMATSFPTRTPSATPSATPTKGPTPTEILPTPTVSPPPTPTPEATSPPLVYLLNTAPRVGRATDLALYYSGGQPSADKAPSFPKGGVVNAILSNTTCQVPTQVQGNAMVSPTGKASITFTSPTPISMPLRLCYRRPTPLGGLPGPFEEVMADPLNTQQQPFVVELPGLPSPSTPSTPTPPTPPSSSQVSVPSPVVEMEEEGNPIVTYIIIGACGLCVLLSCSVAFIFFFIKKIRQGDNKPVHVNDIVRQDQRVASQNASHPRSTEDRTGPRNPPAVLPPINSTPNQNRTQPPERERGGESAHPPVPTSAPSSLLPIPKPPAPAPAPVQERQQEQSLSTSRGREGEKMGESKPVTTASTGFQMPPGVDPATAPTGPSPSRLEARRRMVAQQELERKQKEELALKEATKGGGREIGNNPPQISQALPPAPRQPDQARAPAQAAPPTATQTHGGSREGQGLPSPYQQTSAPHHHQHSPPNGRPETLRRTSGSSSSSTSAATTTQSRPSSSSSAPSLPITMGIDIETPGAGGGGSLLRGAGSPSPPVMRPHPTTQLEPPGRSRPGYEGCQMGDGHPAYRPPLDAIESPVGKMVNPRIPPHQLPPLERPVSPRQYFGVEFSSLIGFREDDLLGRSYPGYPGAQHSQPGLIAGGFGIR